MEKTSKSDLIKSIDWNKSFDQLNHHEKANFCSIHDIPFLNKDNLEIVERTYILDQSIVEERGLINLIHYL